MNRKLAPVCLMLALLLSACGTTPPSPADTQTSPEPDASAQVSPDITSASEETPDSTPAGAPAITDAARDYGEIPFPFEYDSFFPCTQAYSKPESDFASAVSGCDVLLLPTENDPTKVCSLQKGECVELLCKIGQTWDDCENVFQSWYMVGTSDGLWGWVKAEELESCGAPESFTSLRYEYSQGIVIDGCELSTLPGEDPAWALYKNSYVEILAAVTLESEETWLYVYMGDYTQFHTCLWVKADEIKQYTSENMYDILNGTKLNPGAKAYYENGTTYQPEEDRTFSISGYGEDGTVWLGSVYVKSFSDLVYPEPIE